MLAWLTDLQLHHAMAHAVLVLATVIAGGLVLGGIRVRGIGLGSAGVLFVALFVGQMGHAFDPGIMEFLKEFGLVLFVFTIGLQLGPGFVASLRAEGLRLNLLASAVVVSGGCIAALAAWLLPLHPEGVLGVLSGAVTNTPSLGATQQALKGLPNVSSAMAELPAIAYAVAYPGGIAGIIGSLLLLRWWLRIDPQDEARRHIAAAAKGHEPFERRTLVVRNVQLVGMPIGKIPAQQETGVTIARIRGKDEREVWIASPATTVQLGDRLLVVGPSEALDRFQPVIGEAVDEDLVSAPGRTTYSRMAVTEVGAVGNHLASLRLNERFGVTVTRVLRSGVEMIPDHSLRLHFGDMLHVVGEPEALAQAAKAVGNRPQELNHTHFAPIFLGIALGVIVGVLPIAVPGLPEPVRLGLAGGPLLIAILVGRIGSLGRVVWHMPEVANRSIRELGITMFLACVGLKAGHAFFATVLTGTGATWFALGLLMTMVPLLTVGWFARRRLHMNFVTISGMLAGSMTDPPALAFANGIIGSEGPATAYATVYPLTMILRIVGAQILVILLCR
jgi:putative transport protein